MWELCSPPACSGWLSARRSPAKACTSSPTSLPASAVCSAWPASPHADCDASKERHSYMPCLTLSSVSVPDRPPTSLSGVDAHRRKIFPADFDREVAHPILRGDKGVGALL